jgi:hypothetical protein
MRRAAMSMRGAKALVNGIRTERPSGVCDVEQVAGTVIGDRRDGAEHRAIGPDDAAADEIGLQELVLVLAGTQLVALDEELHAVQRLGPSRVSHALEPGDDHLLGGAASAISKRRPFSSTSGP